MKKKYFIMDFMIDEKVSGNDFPQCYNFMKGVNPDAPDSFYATYWTWRDKKFPAFTPKLDGLKLGRKAKLTDFISNINVIPLISNPAYKILSKLDLGIHKFYPAKISARKEEIQCYFLYAIAMGDEDINLEKCKFRICERKSFRSKSNIFSGIRTMTEYGEIYDNTIAYDKESRLYVEELALKKKSLPDYFAIETPVLFNYYVISEHLLQAITENDLTGLKVEREIYVSSPD